MAQLDQKLQCNETMSNIVDAWQHDAASHERQVA
jgi:hypothetical protein